MSSAKEDRNRTSDEDVQRLADEIYARLSDPNDPGVQRAADAINDWTRARIGWPDPDEGIPNLTIPKMFL